MQVYNEADLYNRYVQQQASEAFMVGSIGAESYTNILKSYVSKLYTPNYFIRIALGLLTIVAITFSCLLLGLLFGTSGQSGIIALLIFVAIINYMALELLVKANNYYNAGVDNILLLSSLVFVASIFFVYDYADQFLWVSGFTVLVCTWLCIRFTDAFMAMLSYVSLFVFIFLLYLKTGSIAMATAPFVMMLVSAFVYAAIKKLSKRDKFLFYRFCCEMVLLLTLLTFYASANYFVVKELSNEMFDLHLALKDPIPFGWLFWILTLIIPPAYIAYGIMKKDFLFIRTGLALVAVTIFTIRHYYAVLPAETAMFIAGLILLAVSYVLLLYLKTPKYGFTTAHNSHSRKDMLNAEAVIIAQTFGKKAPVGGSNVQFGGGSFGGGGAAGNY